MKVLVYYKVSPACVEMLKQAGIDPILSGGVIPWIHDNWVELEKVDADQRSEVTAMIGSPVPIDERLMQLLPNLKWIHSTNAGLSGAHELDWDLVERYGISITTSKVHSASISEMAIAMILALYKFIPEFVCRKEEHQYSKPPKPIMIFGKTALVVGTGHIGKEIARKLSVGFDMRVIGINSDGRKVEHFDETSGMDGLEALLPRADVVVVSCALTSKTKDLIDKNKLALMKSSAILINIARGQIIVQSDLVNALKEKRIAGAGLDVFEIEPIPLDDPLWDVPNVLITPHVSGIFPEYDKSVVQAFLNNFPYFLKGTPEKMADYANIKRY